jgi:hypothetical protein
MQPTLRELMVPDPRPTLNPAGRIEALRWMRQRSRWTTGELCEHLIKTEHVEARRGLLIEAFSAVDALHRELVTENLIEPRPQPGLLEFLWKKPGGNAS